MCHINNEQKIAKTKATLTILTPTRRWHNQFIYHFLAHSRRFTWRRWTYQWINHIISHTHYADEIRWLRTRWSEKYEKSGKCITFKKNVSEISVVKSIKVHSLPHHHTQCEFLLKHTLNVHHIQIRYNRTVDYHYFIPFDNAYEEEWSNWNSIIKRFLLLAFTICVMWNCQTKMPRHNIFRQNKWERMCWLDIFCGKEKCLGCCFDFLVIILNGNCDFLRKMQFSALQRVSLTNKNNKLRVNHMYNYCQKKNDIFNMFMYKCIEIWIRLSIASYLHSLISVATLAYIHNVILSGYSNWVIVLTSEIKFMLYTR